MLLAMLTSIIFATGPTMDVETAVTNLHAGWAANCVKHFPSEDPLLPHCLGESNKAAATLRAGFMNADRHPTLQSLAYMVVTQCTKSVAETTPKTMTEAIDLMPKAATCSVFAYNYITKQQGGEQGFIDYVEEQKNSIEL